MARMMELIRWEGRTEVVTHGVHAGFPGVSATISGKFSRARAKIHATTDDVHVRVGMNGLFDRKVRLNSGPNVLSLVEDPFEGQISLFKCTEGWQGIIEVEEFEIEGTLTESPEKEHKLLFIGDSITCGAGILLQKGSVLNESVNNDAYPSFGMEIGRRLGAEVHLVSYGGRGLYRDWQGFTSDKINNAPIFFERATPDDPQSEWEHSRYQPQAISICLGQNDFSQGTVQESIFVREYLFFLSRIRSVHPTAPIILLNSPMQGIGTPRDIFRRYLRQVVEKFAKPDVQFVDFPFCPGSPVDAHPNLEQHLQLADTLTPYIRKILTG